ncbi:universal stress protein [Candidatus Mycobacterium wuenschmannii]|uniref:Universal stress protein n=1 Tax=Candidatus Mycobacterium wuenschmannii TaxID=3027808 RepID=A0ABY8VX39_9MYCO|nr:universal stress protein [Candidatus Mycobacterium wuenschmannii]WIM86722.1 universal stress protein [Candidatus Mycobacterium wuenschmannii]
MADYKVIVVGTDGSETSMRAVDKAAAIAAESNAQLIVASAHSASSEHGQSGIDPDQAKNENYRTQGNAPVYDLLQEAAARARQGGATDVKQRAVEGAPADALIALADEVHADLLVVGSVGMSSLVGRLIGSVPKIIKRRANTEVLVVETDD